MNVPANRALLFILLVILALVAERSIDSQQVLAQTTLGITTANYAIGNTEGYNQGGFFAAGRFWTWYTSGTYEIMTSSTDGVNWGPAVQVRSAGNAPDFSGFFDGTYFQYVMGGSSLVYRRGTPNSDGSITWFAAEQIVQTCGVGDNECDDAAIAVDSAGYPWVGYSTPLSDCTGCQPSFPYVTKDAKNDGTWATVSGFPVKMSYTPSGGRMGIGDWGETILPLSNEQVYVLFGHGETFLNGTGLSPILGKLYDGGFGAQENATTSPLLANMRYSSAVTIGNDIYMMFLAPNSTNNRGDLKFVKRPYTSGTWSSEATVWPSLAANITDPFTFTSNAIAISKDGAGNLYVFWMGSPRLNHIYFMKYNVALGTWDASPTDWITEPIILNNANIMVYPEGALGVTYETGATSPYNIRFALLNSTTTTTTMTSTATTTQNLFTGVGSGSGSVRPNCPSGCVEGVGSSVTVTAVPSSGWTFSGWSTTGATCSGGSYSNPCTVSIPNNVITVFATFIPTAPPLTVVGPITPPSPPSGGTTTTYAVNLQIQVLSNGAEVPGASVSVYVGGVKECSGTSSSTGYFTCSYTATKATHSWYATASKSGYTSGTSPTWTFTYNPSATTYAVTASVKFGSTCRSVTVTVKLSSGSTVIATNTIAVSCSKLSGSVQFSMLNAGTYTVTITGSGVTTQNKTATIPPNKTVSFSI